MFVVITISVYFKAWFYGAYLPRLEAL